MSRAWDWVKADLRGDHSRSGRPSRFNQFESRIPSAVIVVAFLVGLVVWFSDGYFGGFAAGVIRFMGLLVCILALQAFARRRGWFGRRK